MALTASPFICMLEENTSVDTSASSHRGTANTRPGSQHSRQPSIASETSDNSSKRRGFFSRLSGHRKSSTACEESSHHQATNFLSGVPYSSTATGAPSYQAQSNNVPNTTDEPGSSKGQTPGHTFAATAAEHALRNHLSSSTTIASSPARPAPAPPSNKPVSSLMTPSPDGQYRKPDPQLQSNGKQRASSGYHVGSLDAWSTALLVEEENGARSDFSVGELRRNITTKLDVIDREQVTLAICLRILNSERRSVHKILARWDDEPLVCVVPSAHLRTLTDGQLAPYQISLKELHAVPLPTYTTFSITIKNNNNVDLTRLETHSLYWEGRLGKTKATTSNNVSLFSKGTNFFSRKEKAKVAPIVSPDGNPLVRVGIGRKPTEKSASIFRFNITGYYGGPGCEHGWEAHCSYSNRVDGVLTADHILKHVMENHKAALHKERIRLVHNSRDLDIDIIRAGPATPIVIDVVIQDVIRVHSAQGSHFVRFGAGLLDSLDHERNGRKHFVTPDILSSTRVLHQLPVDWPIQLFRGNAPSSIPYSARALFSDALNDVWAEFVPYSAAEPVADDGEAPQRQSQLQSPEFEYLIQALDNYGPSDRKIAPQTPIGVIGPIAEDGSASAEYITAPSSPSLTSEAVSGADIDCVVCGDTVPLNDFPSIISDHCTHPVMTCTDCLQQWITSELDSKGWDQIRCSQCPVLLQYDQIRRLAISDTFERYDTLAARAALSQDPDFHYCLSPICSSGQVHPNADAQPIMTCTSCKFRSCLFHAIPWHEGETCDAYTYRTSGRLAREENARSEAWLKQFTKSCPGKKCGWAIQKNDGCDHMTCKKCRYEFCWLCLADYEAIRRGGNSFHEPGCSHWRTGGKDTSRDARLRAQAAARRAPVPPATASGSASESTSSSFPTPLAPGSRTPIPGLPCTRFNPTPTYQSTLDPHNTAQRQDPTTPIAPMPASRIGQPNTSSSPSSIIRRPVASQITTPPTWSFPPPASPTPIPASVSAPASNPMPRSGCSLGLARILSRAYDEQEARLQQYRAGTLSTAEFDRLSREHEVRVARLEAGVNRSVMDRGRPKGRARRAGGEEGEV